ASTVVCLGQEQLDWRGQKLIDWLKKKPSSTILVFSDKKNWTVGQSRNARNDWCPPVNPIKHPASAVMLGVVAKDGKRMPPYWFPKGLRMGEKEYMEVMRDIVKPWMICATVCQKNLADFRPANFWPPSSPDAAPLDYGICGFVESKACATPHLNVTMSEEHVHKVCRAFRPGLEAINI
ncbi:Putative transposable element, partial [Caligus rogercresseyi]